MSTLLLRLAAPLQAWGTDSKFEVRRTNREPSKSGVIGLLAAALGLRRDADLSKLSALRFGVRVDRNGEVIKDFHMALRRLHISPIDIIFPMQFFWSDWNRKIEVSWNR